MTAPRDDLDRDDLAARPAPVVYDDEDWDDLPPPIPQFAPTPGPDLEPEDTRRTITSLATVILAVVAALWGLALTAEQVTSPEVAIPTLERGIEALTGLDTLLLIHEDEIRESAAGAQRPSDAVAIPGFEVRGVSIAAEEIEEGVPAEWHALLLRRAAQAAYQDGLSVFHIEGAPETGSLFSTSGAIQRIVNSLSASRHESLEGVTRWLGLGTLALVVIALVAGRGVQRFVPVGLAFLVAAAPIIIAAGLGMAAVTIAGSDGSALAEEFSDIAMTLVQAPVRTAIYFAIAGLAVTLPAALLAALFRNSARREERARQREADAGYEPLG